MRGMGQIRELAEIARPQVGVITNVGPVHLELVGTIERVAEAKAELIAELPNGGACVVPAAEEALRPHLRSDIRVLTFAPPGRRGSTRSPVLPLTCAHSSVETLRGRAAGRRRGRSRAPADRVRLHAGAQPGQRPGGDRRRPCARAFRSRRWPRERARSRSRACAESSSSSGGALIINDCYNANPISMRAALDHLAEVADGRDARRRVAVLGRHEGAGRRGGGLPPQVGRAGCARRCRRADRRGGDRRALRRRIRRRAARRTGRPTPRRLPRLCASWSSRATSCWSRDRGRSAWSASPRRSIPSPAAPADGRDPDRGARLAADLDLPRARSSSSSCARASSASTSARRARPSTS